MASSPTDSAGVVRRGGVRVDRGAAQRRNVARRGLVNGLDDAVVAGAPTEGPPQPDPDLFVARVGVRPEERGRGDQHAGRAEAALDAELLEERALQRPDLLVSGEAFDRRDLPSHRLHREVRASVHRRTVEQHHAGAALGVVAAFLRSGEAELVAHRAQQTDVRIELHGVARAVDRQGGSDLHQDSLAPYIAGLAGLAPDAPRARVSAAVTARMPMTSAIARRYSAEPRTSLMGVAAAAAALRGAPTAASRARAAHS